VNHRLPFAAQAERYRRQRQWLIDLEHLLDPERDPPKASAGVTQAVDQYLVDLVTRSTHDAEDQQVADHITQIFRSFWWGLFTCYDVEGLPRTNNELERFIRQIKMGHRRVSGRKNVHDFIIRKLGKATPYGIYDLAHNTGWVSVGVDHDTAAFAVESIRRWWHTMGRPLYQKAAQLLITADSGGSNGARIRLGKVELQKLANETGLGIAVCHLPPGTSKWNKIEHRLFSFISQNWRGKPLTSLGVIVSLIAATTTRAGLKVHSDLNTNAYPTGVKVSKAEMADGRLRPDKFHGDWNYGIRPDNPKRGKVIP